MNETEAEFVAIMMETGDWQPGSRMHRLALLARRGAAAADRIAQLEAALREIEQNSLSVCAITIARAALEEST